MRNRIGLICAFIIVSLMDVSCRAMDEGPRCLAPSFEEFAEELFERGDFRELYELSLPCAEAGDPEIQFGVGILLGSEQAAEFIDLGQAEREGEAVKWIRRAAMSGHHEALDTMADLYEDGLLGLPKNEALESCWRSAVVSTDRIQLCIEREEILLRQGEAPER